MNDSVALSAMIAANSILLAIPREKRPRSVVLFWCAFGFGYLLFMAERACL